MEEHSDESFNLSKSQAIISTDVKTGKKHEHTVINKFKKKTFRI